MQTNESQTTPNKTALDFEITKPYNILDIFAIIILTLIFLIGIMGNSLVIYVFRVKYSKRNRRFEHFLLSLGVIDLISTFFVPSIFLYLTVTKYQRWDFGDTGCKIIPLLVPISVTMTQGLLILISYERYHTIVKPFNERFSPVIILASILLMITVSVVVVYPYSSTLTISVNLNYNFKTCAPDEKKDGTLLLSAILFLSRDALALTCMAFLSSRVHKSLIKQHNNLTWERRKMSEKARRLLKVIIVVFAILTLPIDVYHCFINAIIYAGVRFSKNAYAIIVTVNTLLIVMQTTNSVANVFIYSRIHRSFGLRRFSSKGIRRTKTLYQTESELLPGNGE